MSWVYIDDAFYDHPKHLAAGGDATLLWVVGLAWCNRNTTGGRIPKAAVDRLTDRRQPQRLARTLVDVGLWDDDDTHYAIHDYEKWNGSAMPAVQQARKAERTERARKAANARWHPDSMPNASDEQCSEHANRMLGDAPHHPTTHIDRSLQQHQALPGKHDAAAALIDEAFGNLADRRPSGTRNPAGYRRAVIDGLRADHADKLARVEPASILPMTPEQIAHYLEPAPKPASNTHTHDDRPACGTCHRSGVIETDEGVIRCPDCGRTP